MISVQSVKQEGSEIVNPASTMSKIEETGDGYHECVNNILKGVTT